ncbi:hypothetical protein N7510_002474 [Penicillium lagena]|uniref:uncharacterized protein n=1 Tax=Penicillium lagena TaxID=94218 RepID=UPI0025407139|nr:uncharacterized protein N7510_002474 [Penicillium lagena]KAJ5626165.1 hypothetical protein N7510_002474 [Penicillium lagena]
MNPYDSHFITYTPCQLPVSPANAKTGNRMISKGYGDVVMDLDGHEDSPVTYIILKMSGWFRS